MAKFFNDLDDGLAIQLRAFSSNLQVRGRNIIFCRLHALDLLHLLLEACSAVRSVNSGNLDPQYYFFACYSFHDSPCPLFNSNSTCLINLFAIFGFSREEQHSSGDRRAVEPCVCNQLVINEACLIQHSQEILSRYGSALSPGPVFYHGSGILWWLNRQNLVSDHEPAQRS